MVSSRNRRRAMAAALALLALAGCAQAEPERGAAYADPVVSRALLAPLLTDPDLVSIDRRHAVLADPPGLDTTLPPDDFAPQAVAAARAQAAALLAGAAARPLEPTGECRDCAAPFLDLRARIVAAGCRLDPALEWSLRLPRDVPVYPRAHLREGAGSAAPGCMVSAGSFTAPVPPAELLGFYAALATRDGYTIASAGPDAFIARRGARQLAVIARRGEFGYAWFDLIVRG